MGHPQKWHPLVNNGYHLFSNIQKPWRSKHANYAPRSENSHENHINPEKSLRSHGFKNYGGSSICRPFLRTLINILSLSWFLIPRRGRPFRMRASHELHPLAHLAGLRGYLSLVIFHGHVADKGWKWIPRFILRTPGLQFPFFGGFASLDIFFWISGYVITYKIIGFMQRKELDKVLDTLASSIFRRYFRLFLPILPITLVTAAAVSIGLAMPPENKAEVVKGNVIWWWVKDSAHLLNPFTHILGWWDGNSGSRLLDPFWSLSTEFRSSMTLFIFCTGTCKMSARSRKWIIWLCIPAFMCWQAQWAAMAFLGMWFAECRQQRERKRLLPSTLLDTHISEKVDAAPQKRMSKTPSINQPISRTGFSYYQALLRFRRPFLYFIFLYSFVVLKSLYRVEERTIFPCNFLNYIVPDHWFHQMRQHLHIIVGAFMMLYPLDHLYELQRPLLTPFSQYLGELSFGIYAVHFSIRWVVWEPRYVRWISDRYGENDFDRFSYIFPGYFGMSILVLWAADLFCRLDIVVLRFCKYLELRMFE